MVAGIAFLLRGPLARLIPDVSRLRYRGLEIEFGHQIESVRRELESRPPAALPPNLQPSSPIERAFVEGVPGYYESIADVSPRAAVIESWARFETSARSLAQMLELISPVSAPARPMPIPALLKILRERGLIDEQEGHAVSVLRGLRNELVHDADVRVSKDDAIAYAGALQDIGRAPAVRALQELRGQPEQCTTCGQDA